MKRGEEAADGRAVHAPNGYECDGVSDNVRVWWDRHEGVYFTIHRGEPGPKREYFFVCVEQEVGFSKNLENDGRCEVLRLDEVRSCTTRLKSRYEQD